MPGVHHVEIWMADLESVADSWVRLLSQAGFTLAEGWGSGQSWQAGGAYLTLTTLPNTSGAEHDRRRPGMNHIATQSGLDGGCGCHHCPGPRLRLDTALPGALPARGRVTAPSRAVRNPEWIQARTWRRREASSGNSRKMSGLSTEPYPKDLSV